MVSTQLYYAAFGFKVQWLASTIHTNVLTCYKQEDEILRSRKEHMNTVRCQDKYMDEGLECLQIRTRHSRLRRAVKYLHRKKKHQGGIFLELSSDPF